MDGVNGWLGQKLKEHFRNSGQLGVLIRTMEQTRGLEEQLRDAQGALDDEAAQRLETERNAGYQQGAGEGAKAFFSMLTDAALGWIEKQFLHDVFNPRTTVPPPGRLTPPSLPGQGGLNW
jgi:hypothetical protein